MDPDVFGLAMSTGGHWLRRELHRIAVIIGVILALPLEWGGT